MDPESKDEPSQTTQPNQPGGPHTQLGRRTPLQQMLLAQQSNLLAHDRQLLARLDHTIQLLLAYPWTHVPIPESDARAYRDYECQLHETIGTADPELAFVNLRKATATRHPGLGFYSSLSLATWSGISAYANGVCLGLQGLLGEASAVFRVSLEGFMHAYLLCQNPTHGWNYLHHDSHTWYRIAHSATREWLQPTRPTALGAFETLYAHNWRIIRGDGHASWIKAAGTFLDGPRISGHFKMSFALGRSDTSTAAKKTCKYACAVLSQVNSLVAHHPAMQLHLPRWAKDIDASFDALVARAGLTSKDYLAIIR